MLPPEAAVGHDADGGSHSTATAVAVTDLMGPIQQDTDQCHGNEHFCNGTLGTHL